jgi:hypothetical protein
MMSEPSTPVNLHELHVRRVELPDKIAEIIDREDGGPIRLIYRGRQRKPVGIYHSVKSGHGLPWESRNELHDFWRAEVRWDVVRSRAQPHMIRWTVDGQTLRYTPDREDILANDRIEVVEVKNVLQTEKDPHYAAKLEFARTIYEGIGWSFRVAEKADIEAQPQFDAIRTIQSHRRTALTTLDIIAIRDLLRGSHTLTLGQAQSALPMGPRCFGVLCAMTVRRILEIDLSAGLTPDATVRLPDKD